MKVDLGQHRRDASIVAGPEEDQAVPGVSAAERRRLEQLAYRFLWNRADAEDATQDALLAAHQKRGALRDGDKWWAWVRRIVVRRSLLVRRQRSRRRESGSGEEWLESAVAELPAEKRERLSALRAGIAGLSDKQRVAVTLRYLEQMSYGEIAGILEVSEATARVHVCHGLEALRTAMRVADGASDEVIVR